MKNFAKLLLIIFVMLCLSLSCKNYCSKPEKSIHSYLEGKEIKIVPSSYKFQVPQEWLDWNKEFHNNFHFSSCELENVRNGYGEWDTEYATIVNNVLPFEKCILHAGGEGWGKDSASFADLQMRVYFISSPVTQMEEDINNQGLKTAKSISKSAKLARSVYKDWSISTLTYGLWYGDYGGTAEIDFYVNNTNPAIVLVFMHTGNLDEIKKIVDSFVYWGNK